MSKSIRVAGEGGERNECEGERTKAGGAAGGERGGGIGESMKGKRYVCECVNSQTVYGLVSEHITCLIMAINIVCVCVCVCV